jgi:hypothetical protein
VGPQKQPRVCREMLIQPRTHENGKNKSSHVKTLPLTSAGMAQFKGLVDKICYHVS